MNNPIESLIQRYNPKSVKEYENALKEIIQEITLAGLARGNFFDKAAFYGGSALRIFYGLSRFSEDLDFTLLTPNNNFTLKPYFSSILESLHSFGFEVEITESKKNNAKNIESAFLKANTKIHLLKIRTAQPYAPLAQSNQLLQIKFEVDTNPAINFESEVQTLLPPITASVKVLKPSSLFAGKMQAILFRNWEARVKGRDFYDLLWYIGQKIPVRLSYLEEKMRNADDWPGEKSLTREDLMKLLSKRLTAIDWKAASSDVVNFLRDPKEIEVWNKDFFITAIQGLKTE